MSMTAHLQSSRVSPEPRLRVVLCKASHGIDCNDALVEDIRSYSSVIVRIRPRTEVSRFQSDAQSSAGCDHGTLIQVCIPLPSHRGEVQGRVAEERTWFGSYRSQSTYRARTSIRSPASASTPRIHGGNPTGIWAVFSGDQSFINKKGIGSTT